MAAHREGNNSFHAHVHDEVLPDIEGAPFQEDADDWEYRNKGPKLSDII